MRTLRRIRQRGIAGSWLGVMIRILYVAGIRGTRRRQDVQEIGSQMRHAMLLCVFEMR